MTVFALMPVHNRIDCTKAMVGMLRAQQMDEALRIVVIDDGSSDGTAEWLAEQPDVTVITGDGALWWGGAIQEGFNLCDKVGLPQDWVLLVNDDTEIQPDFVACLLAVARVNKQAVVGSILRDIAAPHAVLSIAPVIDPCRIEIGDLTDNPEVAARVATSDMLSVAVDALSGRGTLYPLSALRQLHGLRPRLLPHYLADYELALRARKSGWTLLVSMRAAVYTREDWGNQRKNDGWKEKYFSPRSPSYLPAMLVFWFRAERPYRRFGLPFRIARRALRRDGA